MPPQLNRRDFLNLLKLVPAAYFLPRSGISLPDEIDSPSILILVFDSWSASNISLYGYPRDTTPHINRWAERAIVYRNHYASGHYTYPSTASFFTGTLPWTHKGYWEGLESWLPEFREKNLFTLFDDYNRFGYTNNSLANSLLRDVSEHLSYRPQPHQLALNKLSLYYDLFNKDLDTATVSWSREMKMDDDGFANSLFLSRIYEYFQNRFNQRMEADFPRGVPLMTDLLAFLLETATDWISTQVAEQLRPFLSYVHMLPPHSPYNTRREFFNQFLDDGFRPVEKPLHPLGYPKLAFEEQLQSRQEYDEFLLYVDSEFNRLMTNLEAQGSLDNTWVILTSDHGEMFERGIIEHLIPSFHKPLMHIPLVIFPPRQKEQIIIDDLTTTVDLLPTLLHLANKPFPEWLAGKVLPPFNPMPEKNRTIFSMDLRINPKDGPYENGTIMMRRGPYKLTYLFGSAGKYNKIEESEIFELYDLEEDPEELHNLFDPDSDLFQTLSQAMFTEMEANNVEAIPPEPITKQN